eukprot:CAMPEP_0194496034 /NCGR_PEP_ID=MMETSP0253-20130528/13441_1 /TAXON_ID=2966 /ORGANISM="Noctiluca scintillans" /LENGTH=227 /DNA_ID=CAMNT_0039337375 /DNA_START=436 /DNA_END=1115 /DNA_ORIENTATION=-
MIATLCLNGGWVPFFVPQNLNLVAHGNLTPSEEEATTLGPASNICCARLKGGVPGGGGGRTSLAEGSSTTTRADPVSRATRTSRINSPLISRGGGTLSSKLTPVRVPPGRSDQEFVAFLPDLEAGAIAVSAPLQHVCDAVHEALAHLICDVVRKFAKLNVASVIGGNIMAVAQVPRHEFAQLLVELTVSMTIVALSMVAVFSISMAVGVVLVGHRRDARRNTAPRGV